MASNIITEVECNIEAGREMEKAYHLLDGGVYENPDESIQMVQEALVADIKQDVYLYGTYPQDLKPEPVDYGEFLEKVEAVEKKVLRWPDYWTQNDVSLG